MADVAHLAFLLANTHFILKKIFTHIMLRENEYFTQNQAPKPKS